MNLIQHFHQATRSLLRNMLRSMLTTLGIVIGIAAVIIIISAGQGVRSLIVGQFESFGSNLIQVETKVPLSGGTQSDEAQARGFGVVITTLTLDDAAAIRKLPNIKQNYAGQIGQAIATAEGQKKTINIYGFSSGLFDIDTGSIASGRIFTNEDDQSMARVAILGHEVATDLFGDTDPVGKTIKIKNKNFDIIGVFAPRGGAAFFNLDAFVYVPIRTLQKQIVGIDYVSFITNQYKDKSQVESTLLDIEDLLRRRHSIEPLIEGNKDKDDFRVSTLDEAVGTLDTILGGFSILLIALAAISLIVGGVGITNIMYV